MQERDELPCDIMAFQSLIHSLFFPSLRLFHSMFENDDVSESDKFFVTLPRPLKLLFALYNTMVSKSEMLCYFVIILNHIVSASFLSLILPILIFLWAMLSVPRPSKRFWMTAIIYTEVCYYRIVWCVCNMIFKREGFHCGINIHTGAAINSILHRLCIYLAADIVSVFIFFTILRH